MDHGLQLLIRQRLRASPYEDGAHGGDPTAGWLRLGDLDVAERIVDGNSKAAKVVNVPGRDAQVLRLGDPENQQISVL